MIINMKKKESVINGVFKYSISSWINIIVGFISVVITTRIIKPETYGIVSVFLSAASFAMYILTFGMDGAFIRFYNDPPFGNTKNQVLYRITFYTSLLCCALGIIVIGPLYKLASGYIFGIESRFLVLMLVLYTYSQAIFRYLNISFRMGFRTKEYTIQNVLINCASRVIIIVAGSLTRNVYYIIMAMGVGVFLLMCMYIYIQRLELLPVDISGKRNYSVSLRGYGDFIKFSLLSAPSYFVIYFNGFMSQLIIKTLLGAHALGIFASCSMFNTIFSALQGGFATYWSAYVYKNYGTDRERIANMHDYILLFALICSSGLVIARDIIYLVIGKEYHESKGFFSLMLVASVFNLIRETTDKGLALAKRNEITLIANAISVVVNLAGGYLLIRCFGIKGAAYANAISAIVLYAIISYYGQKFYKSIKSVVRSVAMIILILMVMIVPSITENLLVIFMTVFATGIIAIIIMKEQFFFMIKRTFLYIKTLR